MASQAQLLASLAAISTSLTASVAEVQATLDAEAAKETGTTPEVDAALVSLQAQATALGSLVPTPIATGPEVAAPAA